MNCPVCIIPVTKKASKALAMAQPDQLLTVTGLERTRTAALDVMHRLRRWLHRWSINGVWAYHLEVNPKGDDGAHAHIWWRGDEVSEPVLRDAAVASRAGHDVDVREAYALPGTRSPQLSYGLKAILSNRAAVPSDLTQDAREYLDLNGGRLVSTSRGFWIDWAGEPVEGGAARARTIANAWDGPLPRSGFLKRWHGHRSLNALADRWNGPACESCRRGRVRGR